MEEYTDREIISSDILTPQEVKEINFWVSESTCMDLQKRWGLAARRAAIILGKSDEWVREKIKKGEVKAWQTPYSWWVVPISEMIRLKKEILCSEKKNGK